MGASVRLSLIECFRYSVGCPVNFRGISSRFYPSNGIPCDYYAICRYSENYCCTYEYITIAKISPFSFSFSVASPAGFCLPLAQTHEKLGGKAIYFF